jgi:Fe-Mn family superoxide dismutase
MELHHSRHHATYVSSFNTQIEKLQEAQAKGDIQAQIAIQPMINFHGGKGRCSHGTIEYVD